VEDVEELSYGPENRMAKSTFIAKSPLLHLHPFAATVNGQHGHDGSNDMQLAACQRPNVQVDCHYR
jgi:hypothetical protein